jgi:hypothetical protein
MNKLDEIYYIFNKVNPQNKLSLLCFNFKLKIKRLIPYKLKEFYRIKIKTLFKPQHSRLRKIIPKHWMDLDYVLIQINFEIIKSFYEDEYKDGLIDWNSDAKHKKFAKWLESAYHYITTERPLIEKDIENAYPDVSTYPSSKTSYKELYGKVDELEKLMFDKDTKIINELVKNREFLWT